MMCRNRSLIGFFVIIIFVLGSLYPLSAQEKRISKKQQHKAQRDYEKRRAEVAPGTEPKLAIPIPPAPVKISEEEEKRILEFSRQIDPDIENNMNELKVVRPQRYERKLQKLYHEYIFLKRLEKEEPDRYLEALEVRKLSAKVEKTAQQYKKSKSESERTELESNLKKDLSHLFDLREKEREAEMDRIKERLARLQKEMLDRRKNKDKIIENHLNKIIGKGYLYEW
jgi:Rad3-related DNA helicase